MPTEIYYLNFFEIVLSKSQIDYVQLNPNTPYSGYSNLKQGILYEESTGNKAGKGYTTRFIQQDSSDDSINVESTVTLALKNGNLVYTFCRNHLLSKVGEVYYFTPTYKSGVYYNKNVKIIREFIQGPKDLIYKYTIIY